MEKLESQQESNPFESLADELDAIQKTKNDGRGVTAVRDVITYLRRGDIESKKNV